MNKTYLLQINDWNIKSFLVFIFSVQMGVCGSIGLDLVGIKLPIIRQLLVATYLLFIPGTIILRCLKIHRIGAVKSFLYSVGLSISFLMFIGFFMNQLHAYSIYNKPISQNPMVSVISFFIFILCFLCYKIDKDFSFTSQFEPVEKVPLCPFLFLSLFPFMSIFCAYLSDKHQTYIPSMILTILICFVVLLIVFSSSVPERLYPFAILVISISLLFQTSLLSDYVAGWDIQMEYFLADLVIKNSFWDTSYSISNVNAMMSITMLAPIFSQISNMSLAWTFKIVYPLILSLVPLGLYYAFEKQIKDSKIAFLSVFFFMSMFVFYTELLQLARQIIAEFYLVLILLIVIEEEIHKSIKSTLLIIFSFSMIVSHYGLTYIFILVLSIFMGLKYLCRLYNKPNIPNTETITFSYYILFIVFTISWYIYMTDSSTFISLFNLATHVRSSTQADFVSAASVEGVRLVTSTNTFSLTHTLSKYLHVICQILITIGLFGLFLKMNNKRIDLSNINAEYRRLSAGFYLILIFGLTIPFFSSSLNTSRLYQISLIFLAPFCAIGGTILFTTLYSMLGFRLHKENYDKCIKILSALFILFLLFNSDFIYKLEEGRFKYSASFDHDYPRFNEQELISANWLYNVKNDNRILADYYRFLLLRSFNWNSVSPIEYDFEPGKLIKRNVYIYFGKINVLTNVIPPHQKDTKTLEQEGDKIYTNGGSEICVY